MAVIDLVIFCMFEQGLNTEILDSSKATPCNYSLLHFGIQIYYILIFLCWSVFFSGLLTQQATMKEISLKLGDLDCKCAEVKLQTAC